MIRQAGFTLMGVLVSLLVLSLGILGLIRFQGMLLQSEIHSSDYANATNLAQSALEERKSCEPKQCASDTFALPSPNAPAPLNRFLCKYSSKDQMTTVSVRWNDADGKANELAVSSPQADCSTEPEIPPPEQCSTPTIIMVNDVHQNARVTINQGRCTDLGGHPWHTWRCTSQAAQGSSLIIKIDGTGQGHDESFTLTANCKENSVQGK